MTNEYDTQSEMLAEAAGSAFFDLLFGFSIERLKRIHQSITWSEIVDSRELQFEAMVLESNEDSMHLSVEVMCSPTVGAANANSIPMQSAGYDDIVVFGKDGVKLKDTKS